MSGKEENTMFSFFLLKKHKMKRCFVLSTPKIEDVGFLFFVAGRSKKSPIFEELPLTRGSSSKKSPPLPLSFAIFGESSEPKIEEKRCLDLRGRISKIEDGKLVRSSASKIEGECCSFFGVEHRKNKLFEEENIF